MDHATLLKIARLRTMSARRGKAFDVLRFATDRQFARDTLATVLDTDDAQLLALGLELMDALQVGTLEPAADTADTTTRFIGRPR